MSLLNLKTKNQTEAGIQFGIQISNENNEKVPRKSDPVFYNKKQALNRDLSIAVINSWSELFNKEFTNIAEPFSGSGIRALRYVLQGPSIKSIHVNDIAPKSIMITKNNFSKYEKLLNKISIHYYNIDAKLFFLELRRNDIFLDLIDIDPYGSPQPFMRSALLTLEKSGIIAITATDMPVITGLYADKAYRLYNIPFKVKNRSYCHEMGLRMFIAYLQREGLFYKKTLTPILSYYADHYVRVFMVDSKDSSIDQIIQSHGYILDCTLCKKRSFYDWKQKDKSSFMCINCDNPVSPIGPIYLGRLHDNRLINSMINNLHIYVNNGLIDRKNRFEKLINLFHEDLKVDVPWFYTMGELGKIMQNSLPSPVEMVELLREKGFNASLTHFSGQGIKTNCAIELVKDIEFV